MRVVAQLGRGLRQGLHERRAIVAALQVRRRQIHRLSARRASSASSSPSRIWPGDMPRSRAAARSCPRPLPAYWPGDARARLMNERRHVQQLHLVRVLEVVEEPAHRVAVLVAVLGHRKLLGSPVSRMSCAAATWIASRIGAGPGRALSSATTGRRRPRIAPRVMTSISIASSAGLSARGCASSSWSRPSSGSGRCCSPSRRSSTSAGRPPCRARRRRARCAPCPSRWPRRARSSRARGSALWPVV